MHCTDNACCISHLFSRFSCKALAFLSSLLSRIDWPASVVATVFFFQLLIFHFSLLSIQIQLIISLFCPCSSLCLFRHFRARGERALITYTIEAIRDMSTEILRTEKDMATHKKYVQLFCLFAIIYWLYILHYYDIECVVSEVWRRRLYLSCLDTSHCHLTQCVCSVSPQIRQA